MTATDTRTPDTPEADTRVLDYVSRAPMTYPVPFDLLPKWRLTPALPETKEEETAGRN